MYRPHDIIHKGLDYGDAIPDIVVDSFNVMVTSMHVHFLRVSVMLHKVDTLAVVHNMVYTRGRSRVWKGGVYFAEKLKTKKKGQQQ